jgi:hypothetical protein
MEVSATLVNEIPFNLRLQIKTNLSVKTTVHATWPPPNRPISPSVEPFLLEVVEIAVYPCCPAR